LNYDNETNNQIRNSFENQNELNEKELKSNNSKISNNDNLSDIKSLIESIKKSSKNTNKEELKKMNLSVFDKESENSVSLMKFKENKSLRDEIDIIRKLEDKSIEKIFSTNNLPIKSLGSESLFKFNHPNINLKHENIYELKDKSDQKQINYKEEKMTAKTDNTNHSKQEILKKFRELRNNKFKLELLFCEVFNVICNRFRTKKYLQRDSDKFMFYERGRKYIDNYFDLVYMIKKFQKLSIMKNCLLNDYQLKMLEVISKPILTTDFRKSERKKKFDFQMSNESESEINLQINNFLVKSDLRNDSIDKNMIRLIEDFELYEG